MRISRLVVIVLFSLETWPLFCFFVVVLGGGGVFLVVFVRFCVLLKNTPQGHSVIFMGFCFSGNNFI